MAELPQIWCDTQTRYRLQHCGFRYCVVYQAWLAEKEKGDGYENAE